VVAQKLVARGSEGGNKGDSLGKKERKVEEREVQDREAKGK
jgi:hypothetical protein